MLRFLISALLIAIHASIANAFTLLSIGDWGDEQGLVGSHLNEFVVQESPYAVLMLGDNFYERGVTSVKDPLFVNTFQVPFSKLNCKFYVCAGNHDWYGNVSAEIEYSNVDPARKWIFPSLYYTRTFEQNGVRVFVVFVDTWTLKGGDTVLSHNAETGEFSLNPDGLDQAVANGELKPHVAEQMRLEFRNVPDFKPAPNAKQYDWLESVLSSNDAKSANWVLVCGHFPVHSASANEHGDTPELVDALDPILRKYNVDAYLSGHGELFLFLLARFKTGQFFLTWGPISSFARLCYHLDHILQVRPKTFEVYNLHLLN